jgi:hypothetical protein
MKNTLRTVIRGMSRGMTPLHNAASYNLLEVAKHIVELGDVDVNSRDNMGYTPLHWAARNKHVDMVWLLVTKGKARVNEKTVKGEKMHSVSALQAARWAGAEEVVKLLIVLGASWGPWDNAICKHDWLTPWEELKIMGASLKLEVPAWLENWRLPRNEIILQHLPKDITDIVNCYYEPDTLEVFRIVLCRNKARVKDRVKIQEFGAQICTFLQSVTTH